MGHLCSVVKVGRIVFRKYISTIGAYTNQVQIFSVRAVKSVFLPVNFLIEHVLSKKQQLSLSHLEQILDYLFCQKTGTEQKLPAEVRYFLAILQLSEWSLHLLQSNPPLFQLFQRPWGIAIWVIKFSREGYKT